MFRGHHKLSSNLSSNEHLLVLMFDFGRLSICSRTFTGAPAAAVTTLWFVTARNCNKWKLNSTFKMIGVVLFSEGSRSTPGAQTRGPGPQRPAYWEEAWRSLKSKAQHDWIWRRHEQRAQTCWGCRWQSHTVCTYLFCSVQTQRARTQRTSVFGRLQLSLQFCLIQDLKFKKQTKHFRKYLFVLF